MEQTPVKPAPHKFECRLKDCDGVKLILSTHRVNNGPTQLVGDTRLMPREGRIPASVHSVSINMAIGDLDDCHLDRWSCLWINRTWFEPDAADLAQLAEFLVSLGINIHTKDGRS